MFNFMKKGNFEKDEKEKRKKEKEGKKKRERGGMTAEELLRLDEVRRSLKIRTRRKEKEKLPSGITADYSENFFAELERNPEFNRSGSLPGHTNIKNSYVLNRGEILTQSDSSEASLNSLHNQGTPKILPPLPPRPPKRGILKGSKSNVNSADLYENNDTNSSSVLVRNTLQNEVITYQNVPQKNNLNSTLPPDQKLNLSPDHVTNHSQVGTDILLSVNDKKNLLSVVSTSPSAESLTDTTNSSFATPPFSLSPVGESQGFARIHASIDEKNFNLPLPKINPIQLPKPRNLTIYQSPRGDFGFQLRRAIITDKLSSLNKKTVIFTEPGAIINFKNDTGLLPGDILLEVNGIEVQDKSREEIIDLIKGSGTSVCIKVQPVRELCELIRRSGLDGQFIVLDDSNIRSGTLKRSGSLRFKKLTAKTDEDLANERACLDTEKLWLVHRGGFTAVRALPSQAQDVGKVKVKVEDTNEVLEVDDDDLEKANPSRLDQIEDICHLRYINESSVLYLLRQRFGNNLIHTYAAGNLIVINPQCTLSIYNEKVAALFRGCKSEDMPPHIYAMAQTTYRSLLSTRKDQSIVLLGRSGSGKTHNFRHILSYLLYSAGSLNKVLNIEKLKALHVILEAFGNARTCLNVSATRCTNLISLDFDQTGQIASLSIQMLMLEKQRVVKRPDDEGTFHVFYWLLAGAEGSLAKQLLLDTTSQNSNLFISSLFKFEDRQRAVMELTKLTLALKTLGITEKECSVIWYILAAIYHLGNSGAVRVGTNKWQFADPIHSSRACRLLGTTVEELSNVIWSNPTSPSRTPSPVDRDKSGAGMEALEGFVIGLYSELINTINNLINRCLTTNVHSTMSIVIVDSPGLQNPASCGQQQGATFSDLCHNYVQERLHLLFHHVSLVAPHDIYTQEHVDINTEEIYAESTSPNQLISVLDKSPPSGVLKTSQTDLREIDRRGLLWLMEEESLYPNSSDDTFLERLFHHYGGKEHQAFIRKSTGAGQFVIYHLQGTSPVAYNGKGILKASKENPSTRSAYSFLQESTKEDIIEFFTKGKSNLLSTGTEGSQSLRRVSSIRRTCSVVGKKKSIGLQIKFTADGLIETLRRTRPRFVFCMLPHHNAGNTEIIPGPAAGEDILNVPLLRSQLRGAEILPAVRMFKQGFPEHFPHCEFKRRFRLLGAANFAPEPQTNSSQVQITINGQSVPSEALDETRVVEEMLLHMDVDMTSYRIGLTQVFFRAGVLAQLESQRDEKLADLIIHLQSRCRGYLARKKLTKLKVQDLAVRCIQRNVRKLMQVREWPWWRLYIKVTPLLNVHRTEEELTAKIQELEAIKANLEKVESERNHLKLENDKLTTKFLKTAREAESVPSKELTVKSVENGDVKSSDLNEKKENGSLGVVKKKFITIDDAADKVKGNKGDAPTAEGLINDNDGTVVLTDKSVPHADSTSSNVKPHVAENGNEERKIECDKWEGEKITPKTQQMAEISGGTKKVKSVRSPGDSRRSSVSSNEPGSRRGSLMFSPFNSFSNIQEKFQALSQDQSQADLTVKRVPKINKLDLDAFKLGRETLKGYKSPEAVKVVSKIDSGLQSRVKKFGSSSNDIKTLRNSTVDEKISEIKSTTIISESVIKTNLQNSEETKKKLIVDEKKDKVDGNESKLIMFRKEENSSTKIVDGEGKLNVEKRETLITKSDIKTSAKNLEVKSEKEKSKTEVKVNSNVQKALGTTLIDDQKKPESEKKSQNYLKEGEPAEKVKQTGETKRVKVEKSEKNVKAFEACGKKEEFANSNKEKEEADKPNEKSLESRDNKQSEGKQKILAGIKNSKENMENKNPENMKEKNVENVKTKEIREKKEIDLCTSPNKKSGDTTKQKFISTSLREDRKSSESKLLEKKKATREAEDDFTKRVLGILNQKVENKSVANASACKSGSVTNNSKTIKSLNEKYDITKTHHETTRASTKKPGVVKTNACETLKADENKNEKLNAKLILTNKTDTKNEITSRKDELQKDLISEAVKIREGITFLTNQANSIAEGPSQQEKTKDSNKVNDDKLKNEATDKSVISDTLFKDGSESINESLKFRKDESRVLKKLKIKSVTDECYPKTQKLLSSRPVNLYEQANLDESKNETLISPTKVEAFLRENLNPPKVCSGKEPVKTIEAVVEEITTTKSDKSKHEKPTFSHTKYTSKGEVIRGLVSIKPSSKDDYSKSSDGLSAITLSPAASEVLLRQQSEHATDIFSENKSVGQSLDIEKAQDTDTERNFSLRGDRNTLSPCSDISEDTFDYSLPFIDYSFNDSSISRKRSHRSLSMPRRIFPQIARPSLLSADKIREESPVVFDASMSFDLGSNKTSLRHRLKPQPAFTEQKTNSNSLSLKIAEFLNRTDHIMEEWKHLGKGGDDLQSMVQLPSSTAAGRKCKSATNIMIKGLLNFSKGSKNPSGRSQRTSEISDRTISDIDELSEMTMDLSEERAAGSLQAERLEAETAERVRLEQELSQVQHEKKNLQQTSERLEMELFYARADVNGLSESEPDLEDGGGDASLYKNKCERAMRELEFTRRRLQQQHEDDLEQLVGLKKQLEKKLTDAYEEVEEQRQVAGQWKRKVQKVQSEMNDLRLLLEEQSSRNNLLEKKQRKFDSEIQLLQEELRSEKNQKERLSREKELAYAEKYSTEQTLSSVRLELELKDEKLNALTRELEEFTHGGGTEQEVSQLRKAKHDLEMKLKEQEEELDELAGQVSMLEGNKLRLEMSLESLRKEHRREIAQRDDELDEARANAQKKIKVLESQLESEHEERTVLVREKHELERRLADAEERGRHHRAADEDALMRTRRDLKKTKALLRDAQVMLERAKQDSPSKAALRALKNQLEDVELSRASAVKAKQSLESELNETNGLLEDALRAKGDAENRCQAAMREMNALRTQVDENEEEVAELLKKYRQTVQQLSAEQLANQETAGALAEVEAERQSLRDQLAELTARLEANSVIDPMSGLAQKKLEIRIKELESRLELEQTTKGRLEVQISRLKENVERLNEECVQARTKEQAAVDLTRKLQRSLRETKEELTTLQAKEQEALNRRKEIEKRLETAEQEASTAKTDLRLAVKRIEDLQSAISGELGSDSDRTESEEEDSGDDSLISHLPSPLSTVSKNSRATADLSPR